MIPTSCSSPFVYFYLWAFAITSAILCWSCWDAIAWCQIRLELRRRCFTCWALLELTLNETLGVQCLMEIFNLPLSPVSFWSKRLRFSVQCWKWRTRFRKIIPKYFLIFSPSEKLCKHAQRFPIRPKHVEKVGQLSWARSLCSIFRAAVAMACLDVYDSSHAQ